MAKNVRYYDIHTHKEVDTPGAIQIISIECDQIERIEKGKLFSAGIHPWRISENFEQSLLSLENLLKTNAIVAVGEIGLDKSSNTTFTLQEVLYEKQLQLSKKYEKPVIIHCVKSWEEIIKSRRDYFNEKWIIHGFSKNYYLAKELLKKGFFLSFGDKILYNGKSRQTLKETPLDRIFLETDTSSADIVELYREAADIKGVEIEELIDSIKKNYIAVFGEPPYR